MAYKGHEGKDYQRPLVPNDVVSGLQGGRDGELSRCCSVSLQSLGQLRDRIKGTGVGRTSMESSVDLSKLVSLRKL